MPKMSDATLTRLIRPTGSACVGHIMRSCRIRLLCPKCRMRCWRVLPYLRGGMCWSHNAFISHPATVPKMSDAMLAHLIRPTGSACVGHIMRSCRIQLLYPKCRMRRWRVLSDLRGRMCRPDKAFTPHPAMVSKCNTLYPFWTSPANQRAAAITPCPKDKPPSPAGKLCGKSNVKSAR
ncbi:hypothetical protein HmCmsJML070_00021 [Escherichia coli]|nr:hypothetical protein HmCmsJML070_00021 [Escherichia coli]